MYYSLPQHITEYILGLQSNIVCSCTLQSGIVVYSTFQYINMHYGIFKSIAM